jgi:hypothetical protein
MRTVPGGLLSALRARKLFEPIATQPTIDTLLRHFLRSICTVLAGERATGTLWLCEGNDDCHRMCFALVDGVVWSSTESGEDCADALSLKSSELPRSGPPNCCGGHGVDQWISDGVRGFISLPMIVKDRQIGCFIVRLRPSDPTPTDANLELAQSIVRLAQHAIGDTDRPVTYA